ncbi:MAG: RdgB/HAM1 family non-canonical purine NTP pyrophosphatase [Clostridia bacterium]|nr:RdgB/HAM1 family non-canonical purine NTP pyrophosphatase [Clostridia bacterium]
MIEIVLASRNKKKISEFQVLLEKAFEGKIKVLSLDDIGFHGEIAEHGETFEENAIEKASVPASYGYIGFADDSGLCVDALGGAPGVYSARYSGGDDEDNNDLLLKELEDKDDRSAKYVCTIACVFPNKSSDNFVVRGECHGKILTERHGTAGFGYDPLFFYEPFNKTFAEVELSKKNEVSHRAVAVKKFIEKLSQVLNDDK